MVDVIEKARRAIRDHMKSKRYLDNNERIIANNMNYKWRVPEIELDQRLLRHVRLGRNKFLGGVSVNVCEFDYEPWHYKESFDIGQLSSSLARLIAEQHDVSIDINEEVATLHGIRYMKAPISTEIVYRTKSHPVVSSKEIVSLVNAVRDYDGAFRGTDGKARAKEFLADLRIQADKRIKKLFDKWKSSRTER